MAKKLVSIILLITTVFALSIQAFGYEGFDGPNLYTDTTPQYIFMPEESVIVYNKILSDEPDYQEIWTGSDLYIPIYMYEEGKDDVLVPQKNIKDDNVEISYKATRGAQYIDNVSIVDGKKDKIKGLSSGSYAKVEFTDNYAGTGSASIELKLVLSVNKVSYQDTRIQFEAKLKNRPQFIDDNSVYGAQVPTMFETNRGYAGEATFDMGKGILYTAKVKSEAKYTIDYTSAPNYDIDLMYPDAYMQFLNFRGDNDTFESVGTLKIPIDKKLFNDKATNQPKVYAYQVLPNKKLKSLGSDVAAFDSRKSVLTIKTQSLGEYVLSNQKLMQNVEEEEENVLQSGYLDPAAREASLAAASQSVKNQSAQSQSQGQSSQAQSSQSSSSAITPTPTSNNIINADNSSGNNPLTGTAGGIASKILLPLSGLISLVAWIQKPKQK